MFLLSLFFSFFLFNCNQLWCLLLLLLYVCQIKGVALRFSISIAIFCVFVRGKTKGENIFRTNIAQKTVYCEEMRCLFNFLYRFYLYLFVSNLCNLFVFKHKWNIFFIYTHTLTYVHITLYISVKTKVFKIFTYIHIKR